MSLLREQFVQGVQNLYEQCNKAKSLFHPLMPSFKVLFKKFLGKYFNEELQLDQFTGMGLKGLTLKVQTLNELLDPSLPFLLESGSVGLLKLEFKGLTVVIDKVEIVLKPKTVQQYKDFRQRHKKVQITQEKLDRLKVKCIQDLTSNAQMLSSENTNANLSWNVLKELLSKIKLHLNNLSIRIDIPPSSLTLVVIGCRLQMRKIVESRQQDQLLEASVQQVDNSKNSSTSLSCTLILMGATIHLSEQKLINTNDPCNFLSETCILSTCNRYDKQKHEFQSYIVIQLKLDVKERIKYNSSIKLAEMEVTLSQSQSIRLLSMINKIVQIQALINLTAAQEHVQIVQRSPAKPSSQTINSGEGFISWTTARIIDDYLISGYKNRQVEENNHIIQEQQYRNQYRDQNLDEQEEPLIIQDNDFQLNLQDDNINKSQIKIEDAQLTTSIFQESQIIDKSLEESQISPNLPESYTEQLNQPSIYGRSCFAKNMCLKEQERGLQELEQGNLIFEFNLDCFVVTIRKEDTEIRDQESKWLYQQISQDTQKKSDTQKKPKGILSGLNTKLNQECLVFLIRKTQIRMQKIFQEDLTSKLVILKGTKVKVNQIILFEIKPHTLFANKPQTNQNKIEEESNEDDQSMHSCNNQNEKNEELSQNSNSQEDDLFPEESLNSSIFKSILSISSTNTANILEDLSYLEEKISNAKAACFSQTRQYFEIKPIFTLSLSQKKCNQFVELKSIDSNMKLLIHQPSQMSLKLEDNKQPALKIFLRHSDQIKQHTKVECEQINIDISVEQIHYFLKIFEQSKIPQDEALFKTSSPVLNQNQNEFQLVDIFIRSINFNFILKLPDLSEFYFMQIIHSKWFDQSDAHLKQQINRKIRQNPLEVYQISVEEFKIQKQNKIIFILFNQVLLEKKQLSDQTERQKLKYLSQQIISIKYKQIALEIDERRQNIQDENFFQLLNPLIRISQPDLNIMQISFVIPLIKIDFNQYLLQSIKDIQSVNDNIQVHLKTNQQQNISDKSIEINCLLEQLEIHINDSEYQEEEENSQNTMIDQISNIKQKYYPRIGIHATKSNITVIKQQNLTEVSLDIYNMILFDKNRYPSSQPHLVPQYGTFQTRSNSNTISKHKQYLNYKNNKYPAEQIIFYKQDRNNREDFKDLIIEQKKLFLQIDQSGFLSVDEKEQILQLNQEEVSNLCLNPDFQQRFTQQHQKQCILNLNVYIQQQEQKNIDIKVSLNNPILNLDKELIKTIKFLETFKAQENKNNNYQNDQQKLRVQVNVENMWISVFPQYNKTMLFRQFLQGHCLIKSLTPKFKNEQLYYSWVRAVFIVDGLRSEIKIENNEIKLQSNLDRLEFYMKNQQSHNMPFFSPILLVQPKESLYKRNRKISGAFQIDHNKQAYIHSLNFHKIGQIVGLKQELTICNGEKISITVDVKKFIMKFKKDSLKEFLFLIQILTYEELKPQQNLQDHRQKVNHNEQQTKLKTQLLESEKIFQPVNVKFDDSMFSRSLQPEPHVNDKKRIEIQFQAQKIEIQLRDGYHFSKEIFSFPDEEDEVNEKQFETTLVREIRYDQETQTKYEKLYSIIGYEIYHVEFNNSSGNNMEGIQPHEKVSSNMIKFTIEKIDTKLILGQSEINKPYIYCDLQAKEIYIVDAVKLSKFSRILGREIIPVRNQKNDQFKFNDDVFFLKLELYKGEIPKGNIFAPNISLKLQVMPIRICLYGATIEFLYKFIEKNQQWDSLQNTYHQELLNEKSISFQKSSQLQMKGSTNNIELKKNIEEAILKKLAEHQNYILEIQHHKIEKPIYVDHFNISKISITISYDGSGITVNSFIKGIIWLPGYNNLQLQLPHRNISNMYFDKQSDLIWLLVEQYQKDVQQNKSFISAVFLENKALKNVSDIVLGIGTLITSTVKDGILIGLSSGSVPLMKALGDEMIYLAKKPFDIAQSVTEGVGLSPVSSIIIKPIGQVLQKIGNQISYDAIPMEFLKYKQ